MNFIQTGSRVILGLIYFVFGLMGLAIAFGFMKMPSSAMPPAAMEFMKGLMGSGYFLAFLKITETTCGFLLLIGFWAPLALVVLAPITLNILMFHLNLTPGLNNLILPAVMVFLHVLAMSTYWNAYKPLFSNKK
jgi:uncharacterized membrane protein YphA (DoxX/SURF4 family)